MAVTLLFSTSNTLKYSILQRDFHELLSGPGSTHPLLSLHQASLLGHLLHSHTSSLKIHLRCQPALLDWVLATNWDPAAHCCWGPRQAERSDQRQEHLSLCSSCLVFPCRNIERKAWNRSLFPAMGHRGLLNVLILGWERGFSSKSPLSPRLLFQKTWDFPAPPWQLITVTPVPGGPLLPSDFPGNQDIRMAHRHPCRQKKNRDTYNPKRATIKFNVVISSSTWIQWADSSQSNKF